MNLKLFIAWSFSLNNLSITFWLWMMSFDKIRLCYIEFSKSKVYSKPSFMEFTGPLISCIIMLKNILELFNFCFISSILPISIQWIFWIFESSDYNLFEAMLRASDATGSSKFLSSGIYENLSSILLSSWGSILIEK